MHYIELTLRNVALLSVGKIRLQRELVITAGEESLKMFITTLHIVKQVSWKRYLCSSMSHTVQVCSDGQATHEKM